MKEETILKLLSSSSVDDVKIGIEYLRGAGYNKVREVIKKLPSTRYNDSWRILGCDSNLWGYYNSIRNSFRILIARREILVVYDSEEFVKNSLGWENLEI